MTTQIWSLLDVCAFCFEKNEILDGEARRDVPYPNRGLAREAFRQLVREATLLYGTPESSLETSDLRTTEWPGRLRIGISGCLVRVLIHQGLESPALRWGDNDPDWSHVDDEFTVLNDWRWKPREPRE